MTRKTYLCGLITAFLVIVVATCASAAEGGERRGEVGIQLGYRWVDHQTVPDDSRGLGFVPGIEGAWALNDRWAIFGDINLSTQDSKDFCSMTDVCNALTPESLIKAITVGFERRFKPGPKNGRWVLGLGAGWIDVEWNGIQLHKGMWSLSFGRRTPIGARVWGSALVPTGRKRNRYWGGSAAYRLPEEVSNDECGLSCRVGSGLRRSVLMASNIG